MPIPALCDRRKRVLESGTGLGSNVRGNAPERFSVQYRPAPSAFGMESLAFAVIWLRTSQSSL
jgi:hypothetical protein